MKKVFLIVFPIILLFPYTAGAQDRVSLLRKKAVDYRQAGLKAQQANDIDLAQKYYEKAIQLDPYYAEVYVDLGIIYEAKGMEEMAEDFYLKALEINPELLAAYTNLALLYEKQGKFKKARQYWKIRYDKGRKGDFWTEKAKKHLIALQANVPEFRQEKIEREAAKLMGQVASQKEEKRQKILQDARFHFDQGVSLFNKGEYREAQQELKKVLEISPDDKEIMQKSAELIAKSEILVLKEEAETSLNQGIKYFKEGDYLSALQELKNTQELISQLSAIKKD